MRGLLFHLVPVVYDDGLLSAAGLYLVSVVNNDGILSALGYL